MLAEHEQREENAPVKLNKTQTKILPILQKNKYATYDELASTIGVDRTTIMRNIGAMKKNGVINRVGGDKNGYWEIVLDFKNIDK